MTIEETINSLELLQAEIEWEMSINYSAAIETALEHLKKIRDGKMVELPCKVGDTVYVIGENDIAELEIKDIDFTDTGEHYHAFCKMYKACNLDYAIDNSCLVEEEICFISFTNYDFGRKVFLNKEEAEKALKEREQK